MKGSDVKGYQPGFYREYATRITRCACTPCVGDDCPRCVPQPNPDGNRRERRAMKRQRT